MPARRWISPREAIVPEISRLEAALSHQAEQDAGRMLLWIVEDEAFYDEWLRAMVELGAHSPTLRLRGRVWMTDYTDTRVVPNKTCHLRYDQLLVQWFGALAREWWMRAFERNDKRLQQLTGAGMGNDMQHRLGTYLAEHYYAKYEQHRPRQHGLRSPFANSHR